jgi:hypothetical protein
LSESKQGIPSNWLTGLDIMKVNNKFEISENNDELVANIRQNNVAIGGPKCLYRGIYVPCFVQYSPHGGITPEILNNCLQRMDELELFPKTENKQPFLLLDGHDA